MLRVVIEEVAVHRDARGVVFEPLGGEEIRAQRNVHVVLSEPGAVRGNHYHRRGTEILTVSGPALVRLRDGADIEDLGVTQGRTIRLTIPPGVVHAVKNTGSSTSVLVAFNTEAHNPAGPDVVREVLIER